MALQDPNHPQNQQAKDEARRAARSAPETVIDKCITAAIAAYGSSNGHFSNACFAKAWAAATGLEAPDAIYVRAILCNWPGVIRHGQTGMYQWKETKTGQPVTLETHIGCLVDAVLGIAIRLKGEEQKNQVIRQAAEKMRLSAGTFTFNETGHYTVKPKKKEYEQAIVTAETYQAECDKLRKDRNDAIERNHKLTNEREQLKDQLDYKTNRLQGCRNESSGYRDEIVKLGSEKHRLEEALKKRCAEFEREKDQLTTETEQYLRQLKVYEKKNSYLGRERDRLSKELEEAIKRESKRAAPVHYDDIPCEATIYEYINVEGFEPGSYTLTVQDEQRYCLEKVEITVTHDQYTCTPSVSKAKGIKNHQIKKDVRVRWYENGVPKTGRLSGEKQYEPGRQVVVACVVTDDNNLLAMPLGLLEIVEPADVNYMVIRDDVGLPETAEPYTQPLQEFVAEKPVPFIKGLGITFDQACSTQINGLNVLYYPEGKNFRGATDVFRGQIIGVDREHEGRPARARLTQVRHAMSNEKFSEIADVPLSRLMIESLPPNTEKMTRIKYQNLVYSICSTIESFYPEKKTVTTDSVVDDLRVILDEQRKIIKRQSDQQVKLCKELEQLREEKERHQKIVDRYETDYKEAQKAYKHEIGRYQAAVAKLDKEVAGLATQRENLIDRVSFLEKEIESLRGRSEWKSPEDVEAIERDYLEAITVYKKQIDDLDEEVASLQSGKKFVPKPFYKAFPDVVGVEGSLISWEGFPEGTVTYRFEDKGKNLVFTFTPKDKSPIPFEGSSDHVYQTLQQPRPKNCALWSATKNEVCGGAIKEFKGYLVCSECNSSYGKVKNVNRSTDVGPRDGDQV